MRRATLNFKLNGETYIPKRVREAVPLSGAADNAIAEMRRHVTVNVSLADSIAFLKSYGAWELSELQDLDSNIDRLLWLACLDCQENGSAYFYMGA
jgi:hypothetical protein